MYYEENGISENPYKKDDSYHFSLPFEYIQKNYGNGNYDIATTNMEIDVEWDDNEEGYRITYSVPDMYLIDPAEGNDDEEGFYENIVRWQLFDILSTYGIGVESICTDCL